MIWFNPIPRGAKSSAGSGKTSVISSIACKDIPTMLDRMTRYGNDISNRKTELRCMTLRSACSTFIPDDLVSVNMLAYTGTGWKRATNWDELVDQTCGVSAITPAEFLSKWKTDSYYTIEKRSRVSTSLIDVMHLIVDEKVKFYSVNTDVDTESNKPTFIFGIKPSAINDRPDHYLLGHEIVCVAKLVKSSFNGTGIPTWVASEGVFPLAYFSKGMTTRFVTDKNSIERLVDNLFALSIGASDEPLTEETVKGLTQILDDKDGTSTIKSVKFTFSEAVKIMMMFPGITGALRKLYNEGKVQCDEEIVALLNDLDLATALNYDLLSGSKATIESLKTKKDKDILKVTTPRIGFVELLNIIEAKRALTSKHFVDDYERGCLVDGLRFTYIDNGRVCTIENDPFIEMMAAPTGDVFVETLMQLFDFVSEADTIRTGGSSSGITRGLDAGTDSAVAAEYINRGTIDDENVKSGSLAGLQSGVAVYKFDSKGHLKFDIVHSHRCTKRDISHIWFGVYTDPDENQYLAFVDTPSNGERERQIWFFNEKGEFLAHHPASEYIEVREGNSRFLDYSEVTTAVPSMEEVFERRFI